MRYVTYDYEEPGEPNNYWHIYTLDREPDGMFDSPSVFTMVGPDDEAMRSAVEKIAQAIDDAIEAVVQQFGEKK